jgi:hypothetical protein
VRVIRRAIVSDVPGDIGGRVSFGFIAPHVGRDASNSSKPPTTHKRQKLVVGCSSSGTGLLAFVRNVQWLVVGRRS